MDRKKVFVLMHFTSTLLVESGREQPVAGPNLTVYGSPLVFELHECKFEIHIISGNFVRSDSRRGVFPVKFIPISTEQFGCRSGMVNCCTDPKKHCSQDTSSIESICEARQEVSRKGKKRKEEWFRG